MKWSDIKFKQHSVYKDGVQALVKFSNGEWCSIVGCPYTNDFGRLYGNGETSFEIMSSSTEKTRNGVKGYLSKRQVMNHLRYLRNKIVMPKLAEQFINSIPNDLQEKLADFLLTIDKRGLDEILAGSSDEQVITKLWEILNKFNPQGNFLTDEMDSDLAFTTDEWDEICIQMAWITEDLDDKPKYVNLDGTLCRNGRPIDECNCC